MIRKAVRQALSGIVGPRNLLTDTSHMAEYETDATKLCFMPEAVIFPQKREHVSEVLKLAGKEGFAVVPRGAGSGMSGGALPVRGGVVMAMNRFDRILAIDPDNLTAVVEPGVITAHLQTSVEALGLFYPPDPASMNICTIGGNVAECAGGLRAVKYGVTRDYVLGLNVVLPTGEILDTGVQTMKGVAGYDLTRLITGSEGTLAVITAITLRLIPKPAAKQTMIAFFREVSAAVQTVSDIVRNKIVPAILEFMDGLSIDCVREDLMLKIPKAAGAMLLIEVDGDAELVLRQAEKIREVCHDGGAVHFEGATTDQEAEGLWEARRNLSPSLFKLNPHKMNEDVVVPRSRMAALVTFLEGMSREYNLPIASFGHAGDGNIHVNIMLDQADPKQLENAQRAVKRLFGKVIEMGGTLTGEHGIGITKAPYLEMEISRAGLDLMQRIKQAFDPKGILNPGKIFI
ncbi:MAG: FAD-linked oxidase C-terminal domain-containing protein [Deltaproteobacteria bacterium]|nr:FAD-linked oxidase C-terminal domain-containing protein [Deltaproteobacteria bacterium]